jgi:transcriptional regulator with XRE-family HTH domain
MLKENFIGERLRELRGSSSLREMAESVGIKYSAWARYEAGGSLPGADILSRICRVHSCSADWLLGLDRGKSAAQVKTGDNSAVAIGTNARATVRAAAAAQGERPDCAGCPYKEKMKEFEAFFNATKMKGKKK